MMKLQATVGWKEVLLLPQMVFIKGPENHWMTVDTFNPQTRYEVFTKSQTIVHSIHLLLTDSLVCFYYAGIQNYSLYTFASGPSANLPQPNQPLTLKSAITAASLISHKLALLSKNFESGGYLTQNDIKNNSDMACVTNFKCILRFVQVRAKCLPPWIRIFSYKWNSLQLKKLTGLVKMPVVGWLLKQRSEHVWVTEELGLAGERRLAFLTL